MTQGLRFCGLIRRTAPLIACTTRQTRDRPTQYLLLVVYQVARATKWDYTYTEIYWIGLETPVKKPSHLNSPELQRAVYVNGLVVDAGGLTDSINSIGVSPGIPPGVADVDTVTWPPGARPTGDILPVLAVGPVNVDSGQAGPGCSAGK